MIRTTLFYVTPTVSNSWFLIVFNLARTRTCGLDSLNNCHRSLVSNFAEDDMFAIEPPSDVSSDEELRTVTVVRLSVTQRNCGDMVR
jgi:hypothetical protein